MEEGRVAYSPPLSVDTQCPIFRPARAGKSGPGGDMAFLRNPFCADKSLCNLFRYLAICNETMCYDNSDLNHPLIFTMAAGKVEVVNKKLYKSIQQAVRP